MLRTIGRLNLASGGTIRDTLLTVSGYKGIRPDQFRQGIFQYEKCV